MHGFNFDASGPLVHWLNLIKKFYQGMISQTITCGYSMQSLDFFTPRIWGERIFLMKCSLLIELILKRCKKTSRKNTKATAKTFPFFAVETNRTTDSLSDSTGYDILPGRRHLQAGTPFFSSRNEPKNNGASLYGRFTSNRSDAPCAGETFSPVEVDESWGKPQNFQGNTHKSRRVVHFQLTLPVETW